MQLLNKENLYLNEEEARRVNFIGSLAYLDLKLKTFFASTFVNKFDLTYYKEEETNNPQLFILSKWVDIGKIFRIMVSVRSDTKLLLDSYLDFDFCIKRDWEHGGLVFETKEFITKELYKHLRVYLG